MNARRSLIPLLFLAVMAAGCAVRLIDVYSPAAEEGLLKTYGRVESLFDAMAEAKEPGARVYSRFADRYAEINELIRIQVLRENTRPKNVESIGIIAGIDSVFTGYRTEHRTKNGFDDFLVDRHRDVMRRMFGAALKAEQVKKDSRTEESP